jgi:hypothetical protein
MAMLNNQRVLVAHGSERSTKKFDVSVTSSEIKLSLRLLGLRVEMEVERYHNH